LREQNYLHRIKRYKCTREPPGRKTPDKIKRDQIEGCTGTGLKKQGPKRTKNLEEDGQEHRKKRIA